MPSVIVVRILKAKAPVKVTLAFLAAAMLWGCGNKEEQASFKKPEVKSDSAKAAGPSENQTPYIMERYLAPEERMRRRQDRISAELENNMPPVAAQQQTTATK